MHIIQIGPATFRNITGLRGLFAGEKRKLLFLLLLTKVQNNSYECGHMVCVKKYKGKIYLFDSMREGPELIEDRASYEDVFDSYRSIGELWKVRKGPSPPLKSSHTVTIELSGNGDE